LENYPDYLLKDVLRDSVLNVYSNGEITFRVNGIHARVSVVWNYEAPEGTGDTHYSIMRGSRSNLVIRQGEKEDYKPTLYVEINETTNSIDFEKSLKDAIGLLSQKYPGVGIEAGYKSWKIQIPDEYKVGHEAHFTQVTEKYLKYLIQGTLPDWEVPNMIAKYYVTTKAYEISR